MRSVQLMLSDPTVIAQYALQAAVCAGVVYLLDTAARFGYDIWQGMKLIKHAEQKLEQLRKSD